MPLNLDQILRSYSPLAVLVEISIIWIAVYFIFRFLRGTRGANVVKGFVVLLVVLTLTIKLLARATDALARLEYIYGGFFSLLAIMLVVVFQPELRQAMVRLGHTRFFRGGSSRDDGQLVVAIADAAAFLSKNQFGAVLAIEREVGLGALVEGGVRVDAEVSAHLLESIFWPNSPLHDLGVVVRDGRIVAASVQFPLAEEGTVARELGSRHRAAVGLSLEADCVVVIVSEETGAISIAQRGVLTRNIPRDDFAQHLERRLHGTSAPPPGERAPASAPERDDKAAA